MSTFNTITRSRYDAMQRRLAERRNKHGRVTQVGRELPFSLEDFRAWVLTQIGGSEYGVGRCEYCVRPIDLERLVSDHATPISAGGDLGLSNLVGCCERCNAAKGPMWAHEYRALLKFLLTISPESAENIIVRLAKSEKLAVSHRRLMAQMSNPHGRTSRKEPQTTTPQPEETVF